MPTLEQESNIKEFETLQRLTLESEKRTDHDGRAWGRAIGVPCHLSTSLHSWRSRTRSISATVLITVLLISHWQSLCSPLANIISFQGAPCLSSLCAWGVSPPISPALSWQGVCYYEKAFEVFLTSLVNEKLRWSGRSEDVDWQRLGKESCPSGGRILRFFGHQDCFFTGWLWPLLLSLPLIALLPLSSLSAWSPRSGRTCLQTPPCCQPCHRT